MVRAGTISKVRSWALALSGLGLKPNYELYDWLENSIHWYLEQKGREWLRSCWVEYPIKDYGKGWDDL